MIEPGTSAVITPAAPMTPTNHGSKVWIDRRSSARSTSRAGQAGNLQDRGEAAEEDEQQDQLIERQQHGVAAEGLLAPRGEHRPRTRAAT